MYGTVRGQNDAKIAEKLLEHWSSQHLGSSMLWGRMLKHCWNMACAFQSWPWERTATLLQWGRVVRGENNLGAHGVRGDLQRFDIYLFFTKFARLFLLNLWDDVAFFVNLGDAGLALMLNMGEGDNYRCEGVFASEELRPRMVFPYVPAYGQE